MPLILLSRWVHSYRLRSSKQRCGQIGVRWVLAITLRRSHSQRPLLSPARPELGRLRMPSLLPIISLLHVLPRRRPNSIAPYAYIGVYIYLHTDTVQYSSPDSRGHAVQVDTLAYQVSQGNSTSLQA